MIGQMSIWDYPQYLPEKKKVSEQKELIPCKWVSKCTTYKVGCNGGTYWCKRFDDVVCDSAMECDAFPDGCGGTVVCRFGGPMKWGKD